MPLDPTRFAPFVAAVAGLHGENDVARIDAWQQRLAWSYDDLVALENVLPKAEPIASPPVPQAGTQLLRLPQASWQREGVSEISREVRAGRMRATAVAETALDTARAWRHANMFTALDADDVMAQAEAIDTQVSRRGNPGPLAGVPVAVKDLMAVRGYRLTGGTLAREPRMMDRDAPVVARLRSAGAVIFGTTNLHELAFGVTSANPHFGAVVNPRFEDRVPGGSSGGSGAAVAAGLVPVAIGTDTGGSVRIPAACCGIVGFKPSYGAVDRTDVLPLAWSLDHVGPLTRTVDDAATAFEVMAGLPEGVTGGMPSRPPSFVCLRGVFSEAVENGIAQRMDELETTWRSAGARVTASAVEVVKMAAGAQFVTIGAEAAAANADILAKGCQRLGDDVRLRLEIARCFLATAYIQAQRIRSDVRDALLEALGDADVLVTPTLPCAPPALGQAIISISGRTLPAAAMLTRFTSPFNMTGLPALSIPCGFDTDGLPVSVQLVGRPGEDARVLAVGRWVERMLPPQHVHVDGPA
jgi:Asp-tRNA(Asn)/Glu-tRNA(Gln) amidotransferase A subunit family amidase